MSWTQVHKAGCHSTYAAREVDESVVLQLLNERDAAKKTKDFTTADSNAAELNNMDICWNDDKHEWYTRVLGSGKSIDGSRGTTSESVPPVSKKKKKKKRKHGVGEESDAATATATATTKERRKSFRGKNAAANARKKRKNF